MKIFLKLVLVILVFLAISSGVTKIMLMPQDVEFFGKYGFTNPILVFYGAIQVIGGTLLAFPKTRIYGAFAIAGTFLVSLMLLILAGNAAVAAITLVCIVFLALIVKQSLNSRITHPGVGKA